MIHILSFFRLFDTAILPLSRSPPRATWALFRHAMMILCATYAIIIIISAILLASFPELSILYYLPPLHILYCFSAICRLRFTPDAMPSLRDIFAIWYYYFHWCQLPGKRVSFSFYERVSQRQKIWYYYKKMIYIIFAPIFSLFAYLCRRRRLLRERAACPDIKIYYIITRYLQASSWRYKRKIWYMIYVLRHIRARAARARAYAIFAAARRPFLFAAPRERYYAVRRSPWRDIVMAFLEVYGVKEVTPRSIRAKRPLAVFFWYTLFHIWYIIMRLHAADMLIRYMIYDICWGKMSFERCLRRHAVTIDDDDDYYAMLSRCAKMI